MLNANQIAALIKRSGIPQASMLGDEGRAVSLIQPADLTSPGALSADPYGAIRQANALGISREAWRALSEDDKAIALARGLGSDIETTVGTQSLGSAGRVKQVAAPISYDEMVARGEFPDLSTDLPGAAPSRIDRRTGMDPDVRYSRPITFEPYDHTAPTHSMSQRPLEMETMLREAVFDLTGKDVSDDAVQRILALRERSIAEGNDPSFVNALTSHGQLENVIRSIESGGDIGRPIDPALLKDPVLMAKVAERMAALRGLTKDSPERARLAKLGIQPPRGQIQKIQAILEKNRGIGRSRQIGPMQGNLAARTGVDMQMLNILGKEAREKVLGTELAPISDHLVSLINETRGRGQNIGKIGFRSGGTLQPSERRGAGAVSGERISDPALSSRSTETGFIIPPTARDPEGLTESARLGGKSLGRSGDPGDFLKDAPSTIDIESHPVYRKELETLFDLRELNTKIKSGEMATGVPVKYARGLGPSAEGGARPTTSSQEQMQVLAAIRKQEDKVDAIRDSLLEERGIKSKELLRERELDPLDYADEIDYVPESITDDIGDILTPDDAASGWHELFGSGRANPEEIAIETQQLINRLREVDINAINNPETKRLIEELIARKVDELTQVRQGSTADIGTGTSAGGRTRPAATFEEERYRRATGQPPIKETKLPPESVSRRMDGQIAELTKMLRSIQGYGTRITGTGKIVPILQNPARRSAKEFEARLAKAPDPGAVPPHKKII